MENKFEIKVEPSSDVYDLNDDRWIHQINQLVEDCQSEAGDVRKNIIAQEGQKGGIIDIIIALGSAGAIKAIVDVFNAWISRDRTRNLAIEIRSGGDVKRIEVSGKNFSKNLLEKYMQSAMEIYQSK
jgi:hypothetical protein